jgi:hypothetical protein
MPNSANISRVALNPSMPGTPTIRLQIRGLGNIAGFKNSKRIVRRKNSQSMMIISDADLKKRKTAIIQSFVSQLRSTLIPSGDVTQTDARVLYLTLSLPHDDCWTAIPELIVRSELVETGEEGADILIERLSP